MKNIITMAGLLVLGAMTWAGCGKVSDSPVPLSPLFNPTVTAFGNFDDGTAQGWVFDYSSPAVVSSPTAPFNVSQPVFQGSGALEIDIPYAQGPTNLTSYSVHYQYASPVDLSGKTMSMWVYLKSGLVTSPNQVGAQLFVKDSGTFHYANGAFSNLSQGKWTQVIYNVNAPNYEDNPPPDFSSILQVGLQISGAANAVFTSDGVVVADSFGY